MKKALLYRISYLVETGEDEVLERRTEEGFRKNIWKLLPDKDIVLDANHMAEWQSTSETLLDPTKMNCGQCTKCHGWTTDCEKPDPVHGLSNGATVNGELLCDECLPEGHPWAF